MSLYSSSSDMYLLLNVPARQSRNYFDFFKANISEDNLVFVDALFGGLDVCVRLRSNTMNQSDYLEKEIENLLKHKGDATEAIYLETTDFNSSAKVIEEENFMIVIVECDDDMSQEIHQKAFMEFLRRKALLSQLRYAGTIVAIKCIGELPFPSSFQDSNELAEGQNYLILEFKISSLDDPRDIVMRKLQHFSSVVSSRTFFGVNFGKEQKALDIGLVKIAREWGGPLLSWRRFFGI